MIDSTSEVILKLLKVKTIECVLQHIENIHTPHPRPTIYVGMKVFVGLNLN